MNYKLRLKNAQTQMDWVVKVFRLRIQGMKEARDSIAGLLQAEGLSRTDIQDALNSWHKNRKVISTLEEDIEEALASYGWSRAIEEVLTYQLLDSKRALFHLEHLIKLESAYLHGLVEARATAVLKFPPKTADSVRVEEFIKWIEVRLAEIDRFYPIGGFVTDCKSYDGEIYLYREILDNLNQAPG